jgi:hypothetical protein
MDSDRDPDDFLQANSINPATSYHDFTEETSSTGLPGPNPSSQSSSKPGGNSEIPRARPSIYATPLSRAGTNNSQSAMSSIPRPAASPQPFLSPSADFLSSPKQTESLLPNSTSQQFHDSDISSKRSSKGTPPKSLKIPGFIYMGLSVCVVILSILDLCLHFWVRYCGPRIGTYEAYSRGQSQTLPRQRV